MPGGRPTEYKPEYCQMLIEHMAKGFSYESFAADVNTCRATLYNWEKKYPEFLDAKRCGAERLMKFWEQIGLAIIAPSKKGQPGYTGGNITGWIFRMKQLGWADRVEVTEGKVQPFKFAYESAEDTED